MLPIGLGRKKLLFLLCGLLLTLAQVERERERERIVDSTGLDSTRLMRKKDGKKKKKAEKGRMAAVEKSTCSYPD